VRVSARAHEVLRKLANQEHQSMQAVLDRAIEQYRRDSFVRAANADFVALRKDRRAWQQVLRERELLDSTLSDGLEEE